jgi:hypothetical protein
VPRHPLTRTDAPAKARNPEKEVVAVATETITWADRPMFPWVTALAIAVALFGAGLGIGIGADRGTQANEVGSVIDAPKLSYQDDFVTRHLKCVPDLP